MVDIVIADDHPVVLMGIKALLDSQGDAFRIVGEAHNGGELLKVLAERPCGLLITDFSMPDEQGSTDGLILLQRLRRDFPSLPVVVLTMVHNPTLIRGMLAAGVKGVVDKGGMMTELLLAIQATVNGRDYLSGRYRAGLVEPDVSGAEASEALAGQLSAREAEIVRLFASGLSITQIAEHVHRSVKTISQQKNDAMRKLGFTSNSQLYEYARASGLLA
ncbi:LuxR family transcriptional regulator [Frateuria sp. Soil773]|uniref:response regulator transcription factor n=1 Tax=Frateuria sp. Soil773 TaxID=1736407 RepID=UPI0006F62C72|nr:response regulator transcription factor [Frateuria sp. Soil773]KRE99479.1 LuxR family transcriptional regulator [Frateuria sp. Soil773]